MDESPSPFIHFHEGYEERERELMEKNKDISFAREFALSDIEYMKKVLADSQNITIHVTWDFDEQQADPFHRGFRSEEFIRRLKRIVEGNPKTYEKTTVS